MTMEANKPALGKPTLLHPFSPQLLGSASQAIFLHTEAAAKGDEQLTFRPDELKTWTECPGETQRAAGGRGQGLSGEA